MSGSEYLLWSYGQFEKMTFFPPDPLPGVWTHSGCMTAAAAMVHRSSIAFYLAFYLGHKLQVRQTQVPPPNQPPILPKYLRQKYQGD